MTTSPALKHLWQDVVTAKAIDRNSKLSPYALDPALLPAESVLDVSTFFRDNPSVLDAEALEITGMDDATALLAKIHSREWTAEDVVKAYIKRATISHQLCNAITEPVFERALERARRLDEELWRTGHVVGPLHGLPVTVKDQFRVLGTDATLTYTALAFSPTADEAEQAVLIHLLESLGAVIIAKTTLPQSIMWCETSSPLFGLTTHPLNRAFTPGGSTGGEGVLLALRSTPLGFGTDIGGSVRIPASMVGIYSLKPSSGRLPYANCFVSTEGQEHVPSSIGPMARSVNTLTTTMRALLTHTEPWRHDPAVVPIPWRADRFEGIIEKAQTGKKLRWGVIWDDGVVRPHPPVTRVLRAAVEALNSAGHDTVDWDPEDLHMAAVDVMDKFYTVDGGEDVRRAVTAGGEPFLPHVAGLLAKAGDGMSVYDYWQLNRKKWDVQRAYARKWNASGELGRSEDDERSEEGEEDGVGRTAQRRRDEVDFILSPVMPHTAVKHGGCRWVGYTKVWNVLDYPAGVVPAGIVCEEDSTTDAAEHWPHWRKEMTYRSEMEEVLWKQWDPQGMLGMPVCLQVVGRKLEDEKVLAGMHVLDQVLKKAGIGYSLPS